MLSFKKGKSFRQRCDEATRIMAKYPDRIPIICERGSCEVPELDRSKYLVPRSLSMAEFLYVIRSRLKLSPAISIYLFAQDHIAPGSQLIGQVYETHADMDGYLYISYHGENTFG
jgi:GABA(A) receptor-associated protein